MEKPGAASVCMRVRSLLGDASDGPVFPGVRVTVCFWKSSWRGVLKRHPEYKSHKHFFSTTSGSFSMVRDPRNEKEPAEGLRTRLLTAFRPQLHRLPVCNLPLNL